MCPRQNPPYLRTQGNILRPFSTKGNDELLGTVYAQTRAFFSPAANPRKYAISNV